MQLLPWTLHLIHVNFCLLSLLRYFSFTSTRINPGHFTYFPVILVFIAFTYYENVYVKDGLSCQNLAFFKCSRAMFSFKTEFSLLFNLYFQQKRASKLSVCYYFMNSSVWIFEVTDWCNDIFNFSAFLLGSYILL